MNTKWKNNIFLEKNLASRLSAPPNSQLLGVMSTTWYFFIDAVLSHIKKTSQQKFPYFGPCKEVSPVNKETSWLK